MKHSEFTIGGEFEMSGRRYRCTDIGTRTIAAIRVDQVRVERPTFGGVPHHVTGAEHEILLRDEAARQGWFNGPPYAVAEILLDEDDLPACHPVPG